jgi:hypothetical protein
MSVCTAETKPVNPTGKEMKEGEGGREEESDTSGFKYG